MTKFRNLIGASIALVALFYVAIALIGCGSAKSETGHWRRAEAKSEDFRTSVVEIDGKRYRVFKMAKSTIGDYWEVVAVLPE